MEITVEPQQEYTVIRISGHVTSQELQECIRTVGETVERFGQTRILLDERTAMHGSDMFEAYLVGESKEIEIAAVKGYRLASVPSPDNKSKNKVFETLMRNRSVNYQVFDSMEDAEAWLLS